MYARNVNVDRIIIVTIIILIIIIIIIIVILIITIIKNSDCNQNYHFDVWVRQVREREENKYVMTQRSFQMKVRYKNDQERQSKISELKITKKRKRKI